MRSPGSATYAWPLDWAQATNSANHIRAVGKCGRPLKTRDNGDNRKCRKPGMGRKLSPGCYRAYLQKTIISQFQSMCTIRLIILALGKFNELNNKRVLWHIFEGAVDICDITCHGRRGFILDKIAWRYWWTAGFRKCRKHLLAEPSA